MAQRRVLLCAVVAATLAFGSACSSEPAKNEAPQVATLASPGSTPAPSASTADTRPRERIDMTSKDYEVMLEPYTKCMQEHGVDMTKRGSGVQGVDVTKNEKANAICEPKYLPLPAWERDPANPAAKDFARAVVTCLKANGIKEVEIGADGVGISLGGPANDQDSITRGLDLMPKCERETAKK
ncbi:hypothetical protein [Actinoplanes sp. NPDC051859]|uniref:hypothetical protein n=1 Tax=Actinoplanes sp. NPDC051859 TaxID=3363909 RepID=UPI0037AFC232